MPGLLGFEQGGTTPSVKMPSGGGSSGSSSPAPSVKANNAIANFNIRWSTRINQFSQVPNLDMKKYVQPVFELDKKNVASGKKAFTDAQVVDFVHSLRNGKPLVQPKHSSGDWWNPIDDAKNLAGDVGNIAGSLNPINLVHELYKGGIGLDAAVGRIAGDLGGLNAKKGGGNTGFTDFWNSVQSWIPGYTQGAKSVDTTIGGITRQQEKAGNVGLKSLNPLNESSQKAVAQGMQQIRGVNLIPGTYTASNLLSGNAKELAAHPGYTLLDLLPYAGKVGEAAAGLKYGDAVETAGKADSVIPKGSSWESLAEGKPLQAGTRAIGLTGEGSPVETWARKMGVSSDIRDVGRIFSQSGREHGVTPEWKATAANYLESAQQATEKAASLQEEISRMSLEDDPVYKEVKARIDRAEENPGWKVTGMMKKELVEAERDFNGRLDELKNNFYDAKRAAKKASSNLDRIGPAEMMQTVWRDHSIPMSDVVGEAAKLGLDPVDAEAWVNRNYVNLYDWMGKWGVDQTAKMNIAGVASPEELRATLGDNMVPKYMADALDRLRNTEKSSTAFRAYRGITNVFRNAVLIGPRHSIHVVFSNGMFLALDDMGVFRPSVLKRAFDMATSKDPEVWADGLARGVATYSKDINEELRTMNTEDIHALSQGKTMGRIWKTIQTSKLSPVHWFRSIEEIATDMSRAMSYLNEFDKQMAKDEGVTSARDALAKGQTNSMELGKAMKRAMPQAEQEAVKAATRVLMDIDGMSPIERTVIRQVMPFYPFTRQLLRYMLTYPAYHPWKAAMLAAIGRIEMTDADSGLPQKWMNLFPITGADSGGNQIFIDTKNMNPFRSMNGLSPWTLAGFMSELNPLITAPAQAAGLNILTATPELYPQLTVDPKTGDLVAVHQNVAQTLLGAIVPQINTVASLLKLSDQYSSLQKSDPQAYRQLLLSNLNMPFVPADKNLNEQRIRYAKNLYQVAQQDTSAAIKAKDLAGLNYDVVPYQGKLYTLEQLKKALGQ